MSTEKDKNKERTIDVFYRSQRSPSTYELATEKKEKTKRKIELPANCLASLCPVVSERIEVDFGFCPFFGGVNFFFILE